MLWKPNVDIKYCYKLSIKILMFLSRTMNMFCTSVCFGANYFFLCVFVFSFLRLGFCIPQPLILLILEQCSMQTLAIRHWRFDLGSVLQHTGLCFSNGLHHAAMLHQTGCGKHGLNLHIVILCYLEWHGRVSRYPRIGVK